MACLMAQVSEEMSMGRVYYTLPLAARASEGREAGRGGVEQGHGGSDDITDHDEGDEEGEDASHSGRQPEEPRLAVGFPLRTLGLSPR